MCNSSQFFPTHRSECPSPFTSPNNTAIASSAIVPLIRNPVKTVWCFAEPVTISCCLKENAAGGIGTVCFTSPPSSFEHPDIDILQTNMRKRCRRTDLKIGMYTRCYVDTSKTFRLRIGVFSANPLTNSDVQSEWYPTK